MNSSQSDPSRRQFIRTGVVGAATGSVAATILGSNPLAAGVHHGIDNVLKVGLIGCGGRGTGAAINALKADPNNKLVALADAFPDRLESCLKSLQNNDEISKKVGVEKSRQYTGLDCHEQLINSDVDVVLLCEPPHFRPRSLKAAIAAGKHVFCEKPVAVDVPGVLSVMETCKEAQAKKLNVVSGLCWRYDLGVRATIDQIHEGAIGDVMSIHSNYITAELWHNGRKPEWSEMEFQMRNWLYFCWLAGDIPLEQHIHTLDKALWLMNDEPPVSCYGLGGRQRRTHERFGNVYDHFAVVYEWANGLKTYSYCRQMNGCFNENECHVLGSNGTAKVLAHKVSNKDGGWEYHGPKPSMYDVEHEFLFRAIREGNPINNGQYMGYSTLMAIMGRNACYTGKRISWDELLQDETRLGPKEYAWGPVDAGPVPVPGS